MQPPGHDSKFALLRNPHDAVTCRTMPSGQPVPVTAMTPYDDKPIPVVAMRVTRAMAAPSLCRRPSSSSDEYTLTLSEHTLFPTPVDARPAFVPFQLSDEQCA